MNQTVRQNEHAKTRNHHRDDRTVLELQLGRNILAIASHHLGHPERAADYFTQSLLEDPAPQP